MERFALFKKKLKGNSVDPEAKGSMDEKSPKRGSKKPSKDEEERMKAKQMEDEAKQDAMKGKKKPDEDKRKREEEEKRKQEEKERAIRAQTEQMVRKQIEEEQLKQQQIDANFKIQKRKEKLTNMAGFLTKKGHQRKNWIIRYFVMDGSGKCINYYEDNSRQKIKGQIALDQCKVVPNEERSGKLFCFVIDSKGDKPKIFHLSAATDKDRRNWVDAALYVSTGILPDKSIHESTYRGSYRPTDAPAKEDEEEDSE